MLNIATKINESQVNRTALFKIVDTHRTILQLFGLWLGQPGWHTNSSDGLPPIQTNWCPYLCYPHHFYAGCPSWHNPPWSQFILAWDRHQICWLAYSVACRYCVDIGVNANQELVDKFCYLGDMLSVDGDADAATETRIRIGWKKFRHLVHISLIVRGR